MLRLCYAGFGGGFREKAQARHIATLLANQLSLVGARVTQGVLWWCADEGEYRLIIDCVMNYVIPRYKGTIYPDELFEIFTVFVPALGSGHPPINGASWADDSLSIHSFSR